MVRPNSNRISLNEVLQNNPTNPASRAIPLKQRRDFNYQRQISDGKSPPNDANTTKKINKEDEKVNIEGSMISNTSSIKMIVPPYASPPDANTRKPSIKKPKFPSFLKHKVSNFDQNS